MSFRLRLLLFFVIIVVVPMIAVALVLFSLTKDSETGKADAQIAQGLRLAFAEYSDGRVEARGPLGRIARDPALGEALAGGRARDVRVRVRALARRYGVDAVAAYDDRGREVAYAGDRAAVAPAVARPATADGRPLGLIAVSTTTAPEFARRVARLGALEVRVIRGDQLLASTILGDRSAADARSGEVEIAGSSYRGRLASIEEPVGPPVQIGILVPGGEIGSAVNDSRVLIGAILAAFLLLALLSSVVVVRALQRQIDQFLRAARRLAAGDFSQPVPVEGRDEFAALGTEFNRMSQQLASKIDEVQRKRTELEDTIRRVGEAFASGLDREGIVNLAVRTAFDACEADAGRAVPIDRRRLRAVRIGADQPDLAATLEAAERAAFDVRTAGQELVGYLESTDEDPAPPSRPVTAAVGGVYGLAAPLAARVGRSRSIEHVGVISIARRAVPFDESEVELFAYLASQAAVSIENADLHETVKRQAVTDELTGLSNLRHFHDVLGGEVERSRRFGQPVGLVMIDLDDFKAINDTYGHQQGDIVLSKVARVLRELSRDIDEPARYGGEEMAVILPQTDLAGAELAAERIRHAIETLRIERIDGGDALQVTASFGVAALPECAKDTDSLVAEADAALYRAKRAGKNRVRRGEPVAAES